jgi:hypothetical protein
VRVPKDRQPRDEKIKVTDKRIFTADGDIREEFREQVNPVTPDLRPGTSSSTTTAATPASPKPEESRPSPGERRRKLTDKATNPGTPFANFIEPLIAQAYMSLGMLRNPYQAQSTVDVGAARQMIDIVTMLQQKTAGNLTQDESDFLATHLGELKLAFVQRTKAL